VKYFVLILGPIPVLFFVASVAALAERRSPESAEAGLRENLLIASVLFGLWAVTGTELLSGWHWLAPRPALF
jgi:hypothetical protein